MRLAVAGLGTIAAWASIAAAATGLAVSACGASEPPAERPMSAVEHEQAAREHDRAARADATSASLLRGDQAKEQLRCIDQPQAGMTYVGAEPVRVMRPCWTVDANRDVDLHRREAGHHRELAARLVTVEREACAGLGADEVSRSPFAHVADIVRVEPVRVGGDVVGARTVFRRVEGLDASWLEQAARCHHARAAVMGFSTTFQAYDPLAVAGIEFDVVDADDGVAITITAPRGTDAAIVWGRAAALAAKRGAAQPR